MKILVGIGLLVPFFVAAAVQGQQPLPVGDQFQVNTYTTDDQRRPAVAAAPDSTFVVVWDVNFIDARISGQRYQDGVPIDGEFEIDSSPSAYLFAPSVSADPTTGNFVVVWTDDSDYMDISGRRFGSDGAPIGNEFKVNTFTTNVQSSVSVSAASDGDFVVVWYSIGSDDTDNDGSIQGQRYASDGTALGGEFQINSYTTNYQRDPSVAVDSVGDFVVVWKSSGSSGPDNSSWSIQGQRCASDGTALGGEFQVNTYTSNEQNSPSVAVDSDGDFVVVWSSNGSSGTDNFSWSIQGQRYASDGTALGGEFQVNTHTYSEQNSPSVAVDSNDDFVVVWSSNGSSGTDNGWSIQGQRYASDGTALGGEFQVNTYTTSSQNTAAVAIAPNTDFVAVWASYGSSGTDSDSSSIQGQWFADRDGDLSISNDDAVVQATPGLTVTYTIVATNHGAFDIASVADSFPAELTCSWTSFAVGGASGNTASSGDLSDTLNMPGGSSVTYTVTCDIDPSATGTLSNTATISSAFPELILDDNSATDDDTVLIPEADLSVTQNDVPDPVSFSESLTYTMGVSNEGPSLATAILLVDALPPEVSFVSVSGPGWLCEEISGAVTCSLPSLNVGAAPEITLTVTAPAFEGVVSNQVAVSGAEIDPNTGNDSSSETTRTVPPILFADGFESGDTSAWSSTLP
ncbi:MAG: DUF11 domain-containing protein [bacterium]|nr:DUF11 domain-containing protein [bacterium]